MDKSASSKEIRPCSKCGYGGRVKAKATVSEKRLVTRTVDVAERAVETLYSREAKALAINVHAVADCDLTL